MQHHFAQLESRPPTNWADGLNSLTKRKCRFALIQQRKPTEAEAAARSWIELEPNNVEAINQLGNVLAGSGRITEGMDCWKRSLQLEPTQKLEQETPITAEAQRTGHILPWG